jgi:alkanesulfonate monooxygenase SsuD/methylene tetrahydromethanopterin reductase-like flavin-dependent oxidoreductase (luciferase family)
MSTQNMRFGAMITPVARRRPWKLARETVSVDQLSDGRLIFGVGLGDPVQWDFGFFDEDTDPKRRAKKLDEGLDVLTGLWSGEPFSYQGEMYKINEVTFLPRPVQQPRIPIWVGGNWPKQAPMRRAARWDGYLPIKWDGGMTPDDWREASAYLQSQRTSPAPLDLVHSGNTPGEDKPKALDMVAAFDGLGITWWIESIDPWRFGTSWEIKWTPEHTRLMLERIRQGPPKP